MMIIMIIIKNMTKIRTIYTIPSRAILYDREADTYFAWWRHEIEKFYALLAICVVNGEFSSQRPVRRNFDVFVDLRLNNWLCK